MRVLGIETSCDDTAAAIYDSMTGVLAHRLFSQIDLHQPFGGVVPELAARDHVRKLLPLVERVLGESGITPGELDGVAYTAGPGLIGALLVGAAVGRSLAFAIGRPAVGVHHMEAHLLAPLLEDRPPEFPFVALLVSGGHTLLVEVSGFGCYRIMGATLDDAAGEAFDKCAKLLGLGYPGGPAIARAAENGRHDRFKFPRPMTDRPGLDFSFSGLKTHALLTARAQELNDQTVADMARAFQEAVVDTLVIKCLRATDEAGCPRLVVAGGVGANRLLRQRLEIAAQRKGVAVFFPRPEFCTDNGAMIAFLGYLRLIAGQREAESFTVRPRWSLGELSPVNREL